MSNMKNQFIKTLQKQPDKIRFKLDKDMITLLSSLLENEVLFPVEYSIKNLNDFITNRNVIDIYKKHFNKKVFSDGEHAMTLGAGSAASLLTYLKYALEQDHVLIGHWQKTVIGKLYMELDQALQGVPAFNAEMVAVIIEDNKSLCE